MHGIISKRVGARCSLSSMPALLPHQTSSQRPPPSRAQTHGAQPPCFCACILARTSPLCCDRTSQSKCICMMCATGSGGGHQAVRHRSGATSATPPECGCLRERHLVHSVPVQAPCTSPGDIRTPGLALQLQRTQDDSGVHPSCVQRSATLRVRCCARAGVHWCHHCARSAIPERPHAIMWE